MSARQQELAAVVAEARQALTADAGRLWRLDVQEPRWILADGDVWWLSESLTGATTDGLVPIRADPAMFAADTAISWQERIWAMVDCGEGFPTPRRLLHEAFHAFWQFEGWKDDEPIEAGEPILDTADGRTLLIIELRAWASALESGDPREAAAAATIRAHRRRNTSAAELRRQDHLDVWEGLAEYSSWRWTRARRAEVVALARRGAEGESWSRSFCYTTGPVLGYALDRFVSRGLDWRSRLLRKHPLQSLLDDVLGGEVTAAQPMLDQFGFTEVLRTERASEQRRAAHDQAVRNRFAMALWVRLRGAIRFRPTESQQWELGTFYRTLHTRSPELVVDAHEGALVTGDWAWVGLPCPVRPLQDSRTLDGPGWTLAWTELPQSTFWGPAPPTPDSADDADRPLS
ncbi:hypothetical protein FHX74_002371 [Friedmanniella endophytica]|uniref:Uncharacterized protein n=1 Tax=Microlunatus kandeliicorticis TaxID=1759536 RepID=A0A7W3IT25_9ACTN|nr:hypothetical protein [Microlunatus kandeliicorticis]MBA8794752.1 hypothetical protein [Microlunatus kandeliicorticis]